MVNKTIDGQEYSIPTHIAIIMDGNGRWAKSKNKPRSFGHAEGSARLEKICREADKLGVKYITVYAFSTENWSRPKEEVEGLMKLLRKFLKDSIKKSKKNNMKVKIIGDISPLENDIKKSINSLEEETRKHNGLNLQIAINYGGRDELIRAINNILLDSKNDKLNCETINENIIRNYLDTSDIPDPDLLIRTSGEQRVSNFLLWQLAYTEFYFSEKYWPEFDKEELIKAIKYFNQRERRFGGVNTEDII
ncbi:MAG: isoprenyl transferase [Eubacteriales bacterium]